MSLDGGLKLTLLGPSLRRLHDLRDMWERVSAGNEDASASMLGDGFLKRSDVWPPAWKDSEQSDSSVTNGSSIMVLAEYDGESILLTGDGHSADIETAIDRLREERGYAGPFPIAAFKLAHHGSEKNVTRRLLEKIECHRFLVSTDGSLHQHPDNQAVLRVLRFASRPLQIVFNSASHTTRRWADSKVAVLSLGFLDYDPRFPERAERGAIVELA